MIQKIKENIADYLLGYFGGPREFASFSPNAFTEYDEYDRANPDRFDNIVRDENGWRVW